MEDSEAKLTISKFSIAFNDAKPAIRSVTLIPQIPMPTTHALTLWFPRWCRVIDQLEPVNQVDAMLPLESSPRRGLDRRGKRRLPLFFCWLKLPQMITNTAGEEIIPVFSPPRLNWS